MHAHGADDAWGSHGAGCIGGEVAVRSMLVSASLPKLCGCVRALMSLLYPMEWKHTIVSACPTVLADLVCSPTPYIIGVTVGCVAYISADSVAAVVIARLDEKRLDSPGKLPSLPGQSVARAELQRIAKMSALSAEEASLLIAQQVTNVYSAFWLGWHNHIRQAHSALRFDTESFSRSRPPIVQPLAQHFCASTMYFDMVQRLERRDAHVMSFLGMLDSATAVRFLSSDGGGTSMGGSARGRLLGMFGRRKSIDSPLESDTASVISSVFGPDERQGPDPDDGVISQVTNRAVNPAIDVTVHTPQRQPDACDAWLGATPAAAPRNLPAHPVSLPALTDPEQTDGSPDEANSSAAETPLVRLLRCESGSSGSLPTRKYGPRLEGCPDCTPLRSHAEDIASMFGRDFGMMHETPQIAGGVEVASRYAGSLDVGTLSEASVDSGDGESVGVEAGASDADFDAPVAVESKSLILKSKDNSLREGCSVLFVGTERYTVIPGSTFANIRLYALHELFLV